MGKHHILLRSCKKAWHRPLFLTSIRRNVGNATVLCFVLCAFQDKLRHMNIERHSAGNPEGAMAKGATYYASASWLRTGIIGIAGAIGIIQPAIPVMVGALDMALTVKAQRVADQRLATLCEAWEEEMTHIERSKIDEAFIETEEFFDLIIQAWDATKRTRHAEKIRLYAKVLAGSAKFQEREKQAPDEYLSVISELSIRELLVAKTLYEQQKPPPNPDEFVFAWLARVGVAADEGKEEQWRTSLATETGVPPEDIDFILLRLQRSGVVSEINGTILGYGGGVYVITETFRKLMAYINTEADR